MGNKHGRHARTQSLLREDSVFSEASWDFCDDIDSFDVIELELFSARHNLDKRTNPCATKDDSLPGTLRGVSVPVPGIYIMSGRQYSKWCKIFGTSPRSSESDSDQSEASTGVPKPSKWRLWTSSFTRRGRSRSVHLPVNVEDVDSVNSCVADAQGEEKDTQQCLSQASAPQAIPGGVNSAPSTEEVEYEGACSPLSNKVCTADTMPRRRFTFSRTRHHSTCSSDAYDSDHSPVRSDARHRTRRHSEPSPKAADDSEDDLEAQLRWLTAMTDSLYSNAADSDLDLSTEAIMEEDSSLEAFPDPQTTPWPGTDGEGQGLACSPSSWEPRPYDLETELDWLCEPEWNNLELELFWHVLRPHLESLLQPQHAAYLPEPCVPVRNMDSGDYKLLDRCLLHVQWHIWKGNYCQAVSDFLAIRRHFRCSAQSQLIESDKRDDVESLRLIYQRKRPSRFRLWI